MQKLNILKNTDIATQLIVSKELDDNKARYLKLLQVQHENKRLINDWIAEYINNIKDPLYAVIMNVLTEANFDEVLEVYKDMRKVNVNENNREFLLDMMRKLELDKKIREEGIEEGIEEGKSEIILKLLIKKFKKLPEEYV